MLHLKNSLIVLGMLLLFTTSCKKDFTTVGNQLIEQPHFEGKLYTDAKVKVYDQRVDKVFTTNLPLNAFGIYNDPVFGHLEADMVSAVQIVGISSGGTDAENSLLDEGFGNNVKLVSANLVIPYFTHVKTNTDGTKEYIADSIYGHANFRLKIYENSYLLSGLDPNSNLINRRSFYSDFDFNPYKSTLIADSIHFRPNLSAYITYKRETDGTYKLDDNGLKIVKDSLAPHFVMPLDTTFFRTKIFDHDGEDIITNIDRFKNYFRGIYIDAIAENNDGRFIQLSTEKGQIIIGYTYEYNNDHGTPSDTSDDTVDTIYRELRINLTPPKVNTYTNNFSSDMLTAINNSDEINGDDKVYIKGDAGAEAVVTLFDNNQFRELKDKDWMINQAELIFYVDDNALTNTLSKTQRLLLYNYDTKQYLNDIYAPENTTSSNAYFDGTLKEDENGNHYYSFKITRHIRNILKNDALNAKLGLRVVSVIDGSKNLSNNNFFLAPDAFNPSGTILYGNQTTISDKKPILKIYYTDPK